MSLAEQVYREIPTLSSQDLLELLQFIDYLKHRAGSPSKVSQSVALEGLWSATSLDITDDEVRILRQQISRQIEEKLHALSS